MVPTLSGPEEKIIGTSALVPSLNRTPKMADSGCYTHPPTLLGVFASGVKDLAGIPRLATLMGSLASALCLGG